MKANFPTFAPRAGQAAPGRPLTASAFKAQLAFVVDSEIYACPIDHVERVLLRSDVSIQPRNPNAPAWEIGRLATSRGTIPVISLCSLWGLKERPQSDKNALLVVALPGQSFAMLVEACLTVISNLPLAAIKFPLPRQLRGSRGAAFETVISWQNSLLVTLQLNRLVSPEFETLLVAESGGPARL